MRLSNSILKSMAHPSRGKNVRSCMLSYAVTERRPTSPCLMPVRHPYRKLTNIRCDSMQLLIYAVREYDSMQLLAYAVTEYDSMQLLTYAVTEYDSIQVIITKNSLFRVEF
ncbi:hypothetical protein AVEN_158388-1 [Araneus ventricosus]|uniref:Uncharacterized protein n=1 Tax=Araneus ventricosus TaxID=182803 RepID=A0A4Y2KV44_ARAVE|nr:hypothetical protein AVEN_158388-1 [Araneus ventricosus]